MWNRLELRGFRSLSFDQNIAQIRVVICWVPIHVVAGESTHKSWRGHLVTCVNSVTARQPDSLSNEEASTSHFLWGFAIPAIDTIHLLDTYNRLSLSIYEAYA